MVVTRIRSIALGLILFLGGCVSTQFSLVGPGTVDVGSIQLRAADAGWNRAPGVLTGVFRKDSELWTRDGLLLDRLFIIPGVSNGGTLFESNNDALVFPAYRSGMLPNEIVELTQSSLAKYYGTETIVESSGLRPHRLSGRRAIMFDLQTSANDGPNQHGRALAFVENDALHLLVYVATELHYFDKHWDTALALMESASVTAAE